MKGIDKESKNLTQHNEKHDAPCVVSDGVRDKSPHDGDGGSDSGGGGGTVSGRSDGGPIRHPGTGCKFVQSEVRHLDLERIRQIRQEAGGEGKWSAHFISASSTALAEKYASFFHEDAVYVGCNGMDPKRLYGGGMESTPFLSALMQLSAIQAVVGVSGGKDVAIGCSIWDCFFGTTMYEESMNSMWRYLYKVVKLGGAGRIDFSVLYDDTLTGEEMERQKKYVSFCVPFFKGLGAGRRMSITIIDKKLKNQLWQQKSKPNHK